MSGILFVNISDIHVKESNKKRVLEKLSAFQDSLIGLKKLGGFEKIILLVSGDLAFSGKKAEYGILSNVFEDLATSYDLIMCAGNHDHDFSSYTDNSVRNHLLKMDSSQQNEESIAFITKGMADYYEFEKKYETISSINTPLSKTYTLTANAETINISTINTAWCSQIKEHGGDIFFPPQYLPTVQKGKLNIIFFHHPLAWFEPNNQKEIRNNLRTDYSIILTGHEHLSDNFKVIGETSNCLMIEAMPFDDTTIETNGFTTFEIFDNDIFIKNYHWNGSSFEEAKEIRKSDVMKGNSISTSIYSVQYDFYKSLLDIGVNFIHPDKDIIDLNDVFVYPNLKNLSTEDKLEIKKTSSETLFNSAHNKILLIGDEYCGKSTLIKKLFVDSISKNFLPLLIEGGSIRNGGVEFDKIINRHVIKQYEEISKLEYASCSLTKVLLLDGFDFVKGDKKSIRAFLTSAESLFDKIIVTVSDTFDFGGSDILGDSYFDGKYQKYEINKLGYKQRYELVNKWNQLKEDCQNEKSALVYKNNEAVKTITKVLGRNYIPSTPFFLLTLLQSMESGNPLEVSSNTYGYYYQYLITQSLGNSSVKKDELDELFNYIKELAHYYCKSNLKDDSKTNLWDFNKYFCEEYGVQIDFHTRFELLKKAKIIEEKDGGYYKFKYPYVYYFFIAQYLSDTIKSDNTIQTIDALVSSLNKRRSMSILMFLTHHSRDESILEKVVTQSKTLFIKSHPTKMEMDADFINKIVEKLPELPIIYKQQNRLDYRLEREEEKDRIEEGQSSSFESVLNSEEEDDVSYNAAQAEKEKSAIESSDFIRDTNLTFKSLEILGQLSRNYYGSLKVSQKRKLLEEAIKAPLRTLDYYFSIIEDNSDAALELVEKKILEKYDGKIDSTTSNEVKETARRFFFEMIVSLSYFFITKISSSIGSANLQNIIDEICDEIGSNSGKLIKLATLLELGNSVSVEDFRRFFSTMEKNHLSDRLLKAIVVNYLYMFERSDSETQQICHITGINYRSISKQIGFDRII